MGETEGVLAWQVVERILQLLEPHSLGVYVAQMNKSLSYGGPHSLCVHVDQASLPPLAWPVLTDTDDNLYYVLYVRHLAA